MMIQIKVFSFNPFSENTYIVYNENKSAFIIDPGNYNPLETNTIKNFISENKLKVKNILLTHAHIDHILGLQSIFDEYEVPVLMNEIEKEILDRNPMDAKRFGFDFKAFEGNISFIKEKEVLSLDEDEFKVYHTPGHSPGHLAYHNVEQKFIISGDVLFQGSIGRTDLYKGNHEQLLESIRTKLFVLDNETEVYSGHGSPTTIGFEKENNPFF